MKLSFTVPGSPRGKARPRVTRNGTYTPKATRDWERAIHGAAFRAVAVEAAFRAVAVEVSGGLTMQRFTPWPTKSTYRVTCTAWTSTRVRSDVDNLLKAALDGMQGVVFANDRDVTTGSMCWAGVDKANPRLEVTVEVVDA